MQNVSSLLGRIGKYVKHFFFQNPFPEERIRTFPRAPQHRERWIYPLFDYQNRKVRSLIRYLKNHNDRDLAEVLAERMREEIVEVIAQKALVSPFEEVVVVPVPMSTQRRRERGFNQVEALAEKLARKLSAHYDAKLIVKHRENGKQALIRNRKQRFENVRGVFSLKRAPNKRALYLIVDDLTTTGATLNEIAKVLRKGGAKNILAVTIAH